MCGRSSLTKTEKELEERFHSTFYSEDLERYNPLPNFNVAPTHVMPVITDKEPNHFRPLRWGLIPFWAKDIKIGYRMINARIETLAEKPSFKYALEKRRCIIPMDGFYEWKKTDNGKVPYRIQLENIPIFSVAGLWENWKSPENEWYQTFTVITQPPNDVMSSIHDRMPAILHPDIEREWLDQSVSGTELLKMLKPIESEYMKIYEVSSQVGNVRNNYPDLINPV